MSVSKKTVQRIAALSKINLSEQEIELISGELEAIVKYLDMLSNLPAKEENLTDHGFSPCNVLREDRVIPSHERSSLLANAPETDGATFSVPSIMD